MNKIVLLDLIFVAVNLTAYNKLGTSINLFTAAVIGIFAASSWS